MTASNVVKGIVSLALGLFALWIAIDNAGWWLAAVLVFWSLSDGMAEDIK